MPERNLVLRNHLTVLAGLSLIMSLGCSRFAVNDLRSMLDSPSPERQRLSSDDFKMPPEAELALDQLRNDSPGNNDKTRILPRMSEEEFKIATMTSQNKSDQESESSPTSASPPPAFDPPNSDGKRLRAQRQLDPLRERPPIRLQASPQQQASATTSPAPNLLTPVAPIPTQLTQLQPALPQSARTVSSPGPSSAGGSVQRIATQWESDSETALASAEMKLPDPQTNFAPTVSALPVLGPLTQSDQSAPPLMEAFDHTATELTSIETQEAIPADSTELNQEMDVEESCADATCGLSPHEVAMQNTFERPPEIASIQVDLFGDQEPDNADESVSESCGIPTNSDPRDDTCGNDCDNQFCPPTGLQKAACPQADWTADPAGDFPATPEVAPDSAHDVNEPVAPIQPTYPSVPLIATTTGVVGNQFMPLLAPLAESPQPPAELTGKAMSGDAGNKGELDSMVSAADMSTVPEDNNSAATVGSVDILPQSAPAIAPVSHAQPTTAPTTPTVEQLRAQLAQLQREAQLKLNRAAFCTSVSGFGQITHFPSLEFVPGQKLLVYCEIENFVSVQQGEGAQSHFLTRLLGSYQIQDAAGNLVDQKQFPVVEDISKSRRSDFYIHLPVRLGQYPAGEYSLQVKIEDLIGEKEATLPNRLDFSVR